MKTKKVFAALLSLVMVLSLAACGSPSNNSPSGTNSTGGSSNEDDTSSGPEKLVVQIAYENNPGEPIDDAAQEWKRLIEERSDGSIEVQLFPSSQLGSKTDLMDQMLMGEPIVHITDGSFLADYGAPAGNCWTPVGGESRRRFWRRQVFILSQQTGCSVSAIL